MNECAHTNLRWNWFDFSVEFFFNFVEIEAVVISDKVDCESQMTESSRPSDSMKIRLTVFGEVEVDDNVDCFDIDTASEEVSAHKITTCSISEVMKDSIAMFL
jgi:hypothetical protein